MNKYLAVLTIAVCASIQPPAGAGCESPRSSQEVANCLGGELRDSDARINQTYQALMKLLNEDDQKTLRTEPPPAAPHSFYPSIMTPRSRDTSKHGTGRA